MPKVNIACLKPTQCERNFRRWLRCKMAEDGITQEELGKWLNIKQSCVSRKLKDVAFSQKDMVIILQHIKATDNEILSFVR